MMATIRMIVEGELEQARWEHSSIVSLVYYITSMGERVWVSAFSGLECWIGVKHWSGPATTFGKVY